MYLENTTVYCKMSNRITTVEECDATDDDSSNAAGKTKKQQ